MARSAVAKPKPSRRTGKARAPADAATTPAVRTYSSARRWLDSLVDYERARKTKYDATHFSLGRMNRLLASLGNPHRQVKMIHIAGTKGKGSTATMLAHMLQHSGYKVGLYTSPHLVMLRERITVNQRMISEARFARLARQVFEASNKRATLTYFEAMTAVAFLHFCEDKVELAVIETGLGGRLDSTNVIKPEVCGITSISYDHAHQLGHSLAAIAEEKAGIIKRGVPVVSAPQKPEVRKVLQAAADEAQVPLRTAGEDIDFSFRFESSRPVGPHTRLSLTTANSRFEHLRVPLMGEHQAVNCGLALGMLDALKERGFEIDDQKAVAGLGTVWLAGRMEMICEDPRILVDGAHNGASVEALMRAIGQNIPYDSMVVIFGCHKDKDVDGMLRHIRLGADKLIFTSTGSPWAVDPQELADRYAEITGKMAQTGRTLDAALRIASSVVTKEDLICITGSFHLIGQAMRKYQTKTRTA